MEREAQFGKVLEEVKRKARQQGNVIAKEEVEAAFAGLSLSGAQMELVHQYLRESRIGVDEPLEDALPEGERRYLDDYLASLEELPQATEGEREAVTLSAMAGEQEAMSRLIQLMLPEVPRIARLYAGQGLSLGDLIGEGNLALTMGVTMLGALEGAKEAQGMLARRMMDAMEEAIAENIAAARRDQKIAERVNRVADAAGALRVELRRKVTVEELAEESGLSKKAIQDAVRLSGGQIEDIENGGA